VTEPTILVEPSGFASHGEGLEARRTLWGYVFVEAEPSAVYYVHAREVGPEALEVQVVMGAFGDEATPADRAVIALVGQAHGGRLAFMLLDAEASRWASHEFLGVPQRAAAVRGTELGARVFRILDEVVVQDERVAELRGRLEHGPEH